jgi:plastocyanin
MNTKLFVGVVVLAVGVLLGWYLLGDKNYLSNIVPQKKSTMSISPTPSGSKGSSAFIDQQDAVQGRPQEKGGGYERSVVSYTDTGFSPSPLMVKQGTTVVFVNESSKKMLVASASYPQHQILPTFVQKSAVGTNGVYEYTFSSVGTWKYQNDEMPNESGVVIVEK